MPSSVACIRQAPAALALDGGVSAADLRLRHSAPKTCQRGHLWAPGRVRVTAGSGSVVYSRS
jgi:hypothetical protein